MTQSTDFWSARRARVAEEEEALREVESEKAQAQLNEAQEEKSDEEILLEHNLPDPDNLTADDNVAGFMAKSVPERLRRRALRRFWRLNPILANVDGLVDYGENYTDAATVVENLMSTYQVGKGMLAHVEYLAELAKKKEDEAEQELAEAEENLEEETPNDMSLTASEDEISDQVCHEDQFITPEAVKEDNIAEAPLKPRRMRFRFASNADDGVQFGTGLKGSNGIERTGKRDVA
ncbi:MAG: DUF3306 domain-containing protein [Rhodobacteraceae bacterium]|nr:DUF3306 domain-containing protein [Paracoccaceae bacterium]NDD09195.1 DUF3306 domain-containing protein [Paracoccaceae bacterium]NDH26907.1 DUF3306 domain-containing protein [Paracoccaceae bacterium]